MQTALGFLRLDEEVPSPMAGSETNEEQARQALPFCVCADLSGCDLQPFVRALLVCCVISMAAVHAYGIDWFCGIDEKSPCPKLRTTKP